MITNKAIQKKPERKQVQWTQSWYEPALRSLDRLLDERKANLRKIKGDEKNAAVLMTAMEQHIAAQNLPSYAIDDPIERAKKWIEEEKQKQLAIQERDHAIDDVEACQ